MNAFAPIALLALMSATLPGAWAQEPPAPYRRLLATCKDMDNSFTCARAIEKAQSRGKLKRHFSRKDDVVKVRTATRIVALTDHQEASEEERHFYSYQTFLPKPQLHVLHMQFYEGNGFFVVQHKSGLSAPIDGFPIPSPDSQRFVVISSAGDARYARNSVEIWNVHKGSLRAEYRYEPAAARWSPKKATWLDAKSVSLEGDCGAELGGEKECATIVATLQNGSWRLKWSVKHPN